MMHIRMLLLMVFSCATAFAQENILVMNIHQSNERQLHYPIASIDTMWFNSLHDTLTIATHDGNRFKQPTATLDSITFTICDSQDVHEAVDLGLSTLWATTNIGADTPEGLGQLYAWGETSTKSDYSENAYEHFKNSEYTYIGVNICGTKYDAAHTLWGNGWRMPTRSEIRELTTRCTWEPEERNGMNGYRVTGANGNHIFLPAAGCQTATSRLSVGEEGFYWTGTLNRDMPSSAYNLNFRGYDQDWSASRAYGMTIRAVK